jgi:CRP-like cAMP-binding protein
MAKTPLKGADGSAKEEDTSEQQQKVTNMLHQQDHRLSNIALKFKRQNVFTAGVDVDEKVPNIKTIPKSNAQRDLICEFFAIFSSHPTLVNALQQNFIFASLGDEEKSILVNAMECLEVAGNFNVITQGEEGDFFYVIERGVCTVIVNGDAVASIGDGKSFGELALLYNTPRQATIRSQGTTQLFSLDRATFRYTLAKSSSDRINSIQHALSKVSLLAGLTPLQLHKISQAVEIIKVEPGDSPRFSASHPSPSRRPRDHREGIGGQRLLHDPGGHGARHRCGLEWRLQ